MKMFLVVGALALLVILDTAPAFARGGALPWNSSPGYMRRLQESRQQYREQYYALPTTRARKVRRHR